MSSNALSKMNKSDLISAVGSTVPVLAFDWTPDAVATVTESEFSERANAIVKTGDGMDGMLTVFRSQMAYAAKFTLDLIGKGKTYETDSEFGDALGVSGSQVTRLKRLGRAVQVHGVPVEFSDRGQTATLWQDLTRVVNDSKPIREALDADDKIDLPWLRETIDNHNKMVAESKAKADAEKAAKAARGETGENKPDAKASNADLFAVLYNRLASVADGNNPQAAQDFLTRATELASKAQDVLAELIASGETVESEAV